MPVHILSLYPLSQSERPNNYSQQRPSVHNCRFWQERFDLVLWSIEPRDLDHNPHLWPLGFQRYHSRVCTTYGSRDRYLSEFVNYSLWKVFTRAIGPVSVVDRDLELWPISIFRLLLLLLLSSLSSYDFRFRRYSRKNLYFGRISGTWSSYDDADGTVGKPVPELGMVAPTPESLRVTVPEFWSKMQLAIEMKCENVTKVSRAKSVPEKMIGSIFRVIWSLEYAKLN